MDLFEHMHAKFLDKHLAGRNGERKGRLLRGHKHGEKLFLQNVWWPIFGNFVHLQREVQLLTQPRNFSNRFRLENDSLFLRRYPGASRGVPHAAANGNRSLIDA